MDVSVNEKIERAEQLANDLWESIAVIEGTNKMLDNMAQPIKDICVVSENQEAGISIMAVLTAGQQSALLDSITKMIEDNRDSATRKLDKLMERKGSKPAIINKDFDDEVNKMIENNKVAPVQQKAESNQAAVKTEEEKTEHPSKHAEIHIPEKLQTADKKDGKRVTSKDILSDKELHEWYFRLNMKVKEIALKSGLTEAVVYKRVEQMKAEIKKKDKECARQ